MLRLNGYQRILFRATSYGNCFEKMTFHMATLLIRKVDLTELVTLNVMEYSYLKHHYLKFPFR